MTPEERIVRRALDQIRRVSAGADELVPMFGHVMPYTGADLMTLSVPERAGSVAYIKRFEQLQDLVNRLARALAAWQGVDTNNITHRDVANWLEKNDQVSDAEDRMVLVRLRNRLVHEYPIEGDEQIRRLNECWTAMPHLREIARSLTALAVAEGTAT